MIGWSILLFTPVRQTFGQFYKPSEKTVRMGEALPESVFQAVHYAVHARTGEATTLKLADYRDKLIILDFWATWCGPCIGSLNKLDSLQRTLQNDNYLVIPVTYQTRQETAPAFRRFQWDMVSVISDTLLSQVFPYAGIPHMVWIKDGRVLSIPKNTYATAENIIKAINGETPHMALNIQDLVLDPHKPLFVKGNGQTAVCYENAYAKIVRYLPGYRMAHVTYVQQGDTTVLYANNLDIMQLFFQAFRPDIFPTFGKDKGVILHLPDSLKKRLLTRPKYSDDGNPAADRAYNDWNVANLYGYELRFPGRISKTEALRLMQQDVNRFFGAEKQLTGKIVDGPVHTYAVLKAATDTARIRAMLKTAKASPGWDNNDQTYTRYRAQFQQHLVWWLQSKLPAEVTIRQIIDSTGIDPDFLTDFRFSKAIDRDFSVLQQELETYGLRLHIEKKPVPVLVMSQGTALPDNH